ncbi:tail fiber domain-containing protein, partial [Candidatus Nomurabacteria bacterium]|nr:tail fiber domain-containing protein [Candidatus Nomurabacteria bacterium]
MPDTYWQSATGGIHYSNGSVGINTDDLTNALFTIVGQDPDNYVHLLGDNGGEGNTISLSVSDMNAGAVSGSAHFDMRPDMFDLYYESPDGLAMGEMYLAPGGLDVYAFQQIDEDFAFSASFSVFSAFGEGPMAKDLSGMWKVSDDNTGSFFSVGVGGMGYRKGGGSVATAKFLTGRFSSSPYVSDDFSNNFFSFSGGSIFLSANGDNTAAMLFGENQNELSSSGYSIEDIAYGIRSNNGIMEYANQQTESEQTTEWIPFNSLGGGGDFIPLTGTENGSPVTGSIEIAQSNLYPLRKTFVGPSITDMAIGIFDNDDPDSSTRGAGLGFIMQGSLVNQAVIQAYSEVSSTSLSIFANNRIDDGVLLTTDLSSRGLYGNAYFGPNYDDFTYVQKKYVDDALDLLSSDERLKKNMTDLPSTLNTLSGVRTVSYNWNTEHDTDPQHIGFIAQDLKNYYPDLVSKQPDGYYKVSYALMTPILTKAIQEINTNITDISDLTRENTWRDSLIAWLGDITNGINRIFAHEVRTDRLCIAKADGSDVCLTGEQVEEIVGSATPAIDSDEPVSEEIPNVPEEEMESDTAAEGSQAPSGDTDGAGEQIPENIPEEVPTDMSVPEESVQEDAVSSETLAVPEIPTL